MGRGSLPGAIDKHDTRGGRNGKENAPDAHARRAGERPVAELRDRPQAPGQGQRHDGRPHGPARGVLPDQEGLLEGRHRERLRLRRRHHPALHRAQGRGGQAPVPRRGRVPHAARHAAPGHALQHGHPAQVLRHLGAPRLRPHRLPRPERRHHVPGRALGQGAGRLRRDQPARLRPGRRRPGRAHVDVVRGRGALRAVVLRRGGRAPHRPQQLHRTTSTARRCPTSSSSSSRAARTTA